MAESMTCPACGARNRVGSPPPDSATCGRCGRKLNFSASAGAGASPPPRRRRSRGAAEAPAEEAAATGRAVSSGGDAPPAPRRRRGATAAQPASGSGGPDTAVLQPSAPAARGASSGGGPVTVAAPIEGRAAAPSRVRSGGGAGPSRLVRILAWVVALPIALIAVGLPARKAGYLNSQRLLDVIVKQDIGRFVPLLVIVALWALATALLVTLFLEGAKRLHRDRAGVPAIVGDGAVPARHGRRRRS